MQIITNTDVYTLPVDVLPPLLEVMYSISPEPCRIDYLSDYQVGMLYSILVEKKASDNIDLEMLDFLCVDRNAIPCLAKLLCDDYDEFIYIISEHTDLALI